MRAVLEDWNLEESDLSKTALAWRCAGIMGIKLDVPTLVNLLDFAKPLESRYRFKITRPDDYPYPAIHSLSLIGRAALRPLVGEILKHPDSLKGQNALETIVRIFDSNEQAAAYLAGAAAMTTGEVKKILDQAAGQLDPASSLYFRFEATGPAETAQVRGRFQIRNEGAKSVYIPDPVVENGLGAFPQNASGGEGSVATLLLVDIGDSEVSYSVTFRCLMGVNCVELKPREALDSDEVVVPNPGFDSESAVTKPEETVDTGKTCFCGSAQLQFYKDGGERVRKFAGSRQSGFCASFRR